MSGKDAVCGSQSRQDLTKIKECIREDIIRCMNRERVVSDEEIKDMIQQRVLDLGHEMYFSVTQKQEMIQGILIHCVNWIFYRKFWNKMMSQRSW